MKPSRLRSLAGRLCRSTARTASFLGLLEDVPFAPPSGHTYSFAASSAAVSLAGRASTPSPTSTKSFSVSTRSLAAGYAAAAGPTVSAIVPDIHIKNLVAEIEGLLIELTAGHSKVRRKGYRGSRC